MFLLMGFPPAIIINKNNFCQVTVTIVKIENVCKTRASPFNPGMYGSFSFIPDWGTIDSVGFSLLWHSEGHAGDESEGDETLFEQFLHDLFEFMVLTANEVKG